MLLQTCVTQQPRVRCHHRGTLVPLSGCVGTCLRSPQLFVIVFLVFLESLQRRLLLGRQTELSRVFVMLQVRLDIRDIGIKVVYQRLETLDHCFIPRVFRQKFLGLLFSRNGVGANLLAGAGRGRDPASSARWRNLRQRQPIVRALPRRRRWWWSIASAQWRRGPIAARTARCRPAGCRSAWSWSRFSGPRSCAGRRGSVPSAWRFLRAAWRISISWRLARLRSRSRGLLLRCATARLSPRRAGIFLRRAAIRRCTRLPLARPTRRRFIDHQLALVALRLRCALTDTRRRRRLVLINLELHLKERAVLLALRTARYARDHDIPAIKPRRNASGIHKQHALAAAVRVDRDRLHGAEQFAELSVGGYGKALLLRTLVRHRHRQHCLLACKQMSWRRGFCRLRLLRPCDGAMQKTAASTAAIIFLSRCLLMRSCLPSTGPAFGKISCPHSCSPAPVRPSRTTPPCFEPRKSRRQWF